MNGELSESILADRVSKLEESVNLVLNRLNAVCDYNSGAANVELKSREYLSIKDAANLSGLSAKHIRRLILTGKLPASNVGLGDKVRYIIAKHEFLAFIEKRKACGKPVSTDDQELIKRYLPKLSSGD